MRNSSSWIILQHSIRGYINCYQLNDQYVADYTEQFYKLMSRVNLYEPDNQLVARYVSGLKYNLKEFMMHSFNSLKEAYQMALKVEEKLKWSSYWRT